jgi:hypothetical protein
LYKQGVFLSRKKVRRKTFRINTFRSAPYIDEHGQVVVKEKKEEAMPVLNRRGHGLVVSELLKMNNTPLPFCSILESRKVIIQAPEGVQNSPLQLRFFCSLFMDFGPGQPGNPLSFLPNIRMSQILWYTSHYFLLVRFSTCLLQNTRMTIGENTSRITNA